MKKLYSTILLAGVCASMMAQTATLKATGTDVSELVPAGWERVKSESGDVNHDGINDLVVMALPNDAEKIYTRDDGFVINMNAPVVAVYFGKGDGSYELYAQSSNIVPEQSQMFFVDNESLTINKKGVFTVTYSTFASAGSWTNYTCGSTYRYQDGGLYLIGESETSYNRSTLETETVSVNYLTGKRCTRSKTEKWENIGKKPLKRFGAGLGSEM